MRKAPVRRNNRALIGATLFSLVIIVQFYGAIAYATPPASPGDVHIM